FLSWVFFEMERVAVRGSLIRSLVRDDRGQFLGWYVYYLKPGGAGWVIQVAAKRGKVDSVVDHLFHHAYTNGAGAVQGRAEPHLMEALSRRRCLLRYHGGSMIHTRDTAPPATVVSIRAAQPANQDGSNRSTVPFARVASTSTIWPSDRTLVAKSVPR